MTKQTHSDDRFQKLNRCFQQLFQELGQFDDRVNEAHEVTANVTAERLGQDRLLALARRIHLIDGLMLQVQSNLQEVKWLILHRPQ